MRPGSTLPGSHGFDAPDLTGAELAALREAALLSRGDVLAMTTLAGAGHPAASLGSVEVELALLGLSASDPADPFRRDRDRIVSGDPDTTPAVFAALARLGFVDVSLPPIAFVRGGSPFGMVAGREVPGIE